MDLVDTHAHLDSHRFEQDREEVIARAAQAGVNRILTCGVDLVSSRAALTLAHAHEGIYAAVGIHAHEAHSAIGVGSEGRLEPQRAVLEALTELAGEDKVVAVGELGLDYHYDRSPREEQRAMLSGLLQLAHELGLPVILHNREADQDLMAILDAAPQGLRGVLHCFTSSSQLAEWGTARGLCFGLGGPITFRNAGHLPAVVRQIPLDRMLVETDSPYLAPHPLRGQRNEPAYLTYVVQRLAEILDLTPQEVGQRTTENARRLFGLP